MSSSGRGESTSVTFILVSCCSRVGMVKVHVAQPNNSSNETSGALRIDWIQEYPSSSEEGACIEHGSVWVKMWFEVELHIILLFWTESQDKREGKELWQLDLVFCLVFWVLVVVWIAESRSSGIEKSDSMKDGWLTTPLVINLYIFCQPIPLTPYTLAFSIYSKQIRDGNIAEIRVASSINREWKNNTTIHPDLLRHYSIFISTRKSWSLSLHFRRFNSIHDIKHSSHFYNP